jgi:branched-chain amino acid transport system substrate-binding protein
MSRHLFCNLTLAVVAALALLAAPAQQVLAADKVIKIGALLPISGPASYFGVGDKQGIDLALEQLNAKGVNGYNFQIQYEDSACNPLNATQAAKLLLDEYKPDVVIGEECSDATLAIMPLMAQVEIPLVNSGSASIKITEPGNPWTFRIMPNEVMQGIDLAKNAYEKLGARTAVVLHENTNAGIGGANVFADNFKKEGGSVLADIGFGRDLNDFTAIATRIASMGNVDVIPTGTLEGQGVKITQALAQAGVTKGGGGHAIQMGAIWLPYGFDQKAGNASVGYIRIVQFDPNEQRPAVVDFVKAFKAKYQQDPTHIDAHSFDQIMLIGDTIRRGATDAKSIREQLAATKNFAGATGTIDFDSHNQNVGADTIHYVETQPDLSWKLLDWK